MAIQITFTPWKLLVSVMIVAAVIATTSLTVAVLPPDVSPAIIVHPDGTEEFICGEHSWLSSLVVVVVLVEDQ